MKIRKAGIHDLTQLGCMYREIVRHMEHQDIFVWDDVYPLIRFPQDIRDGHLFLLEDGTGLAAAFALYQECPADPSLGWKAPEAPALYLARLGVSPSRMRSGLGSRALQAAMSLAQAQGAQWLRLFVVDNNAPALAFYAKNGFCQVSGHRTDDVGTGILCELGFEISLM